MSTECPDTSDDDTFPHGPGREPNGFYLPGKCRRADKCKMRRRGWLGRKTEELERVRDNDEKAFLAPRWQ